MAVTNEIYILSMTFLLIYVTVYKSNQIIGSIMMIAASMATLMFSTGNIVTACGYILLICSFISLLYGWLKPLANAG